MMKTLWKNSLMTAEDVRIIHVNFTVTAVTFTEKKNEDITFVPTLIHLSSKKLQTSGRVSKFNNSNSGMKTVYVQY
jgi:hypothetical protein